MSNPNSTEDRYMAFCERNDLDSMLCMFSQLDYLEEIGNERLIRTLNGILFPVKKQSKVEKVIDAAISLVVDMTPKRASSKFEPLCVAVNPAVLSNSKRTKSGHIQFGFNF